MAWGKAGERLTEEEAARRAKAARDRQAREHMAGKVAMEEAERRWSKGMVKPWRITTALNLRELYGPEVDRACGVEEPAVDRWEAGELYPTWEQLLALSELTRFPPGFFTRLGDPPDIGALHICPPIRNAPPAQDYVLEFSHEALVMAGIRPPSPPPGHLYDGRLF